MFFPFFRQNRHDPYHLSHSGGQLRQGLDKAQFLEFSKFLEISLKTFLSKKKSEPLSPFIVGA